MSNIIEKKEVLNTAYTYMEKLISGINAAVELFRAGNEYDALEYMKYIIEGLQWEIEVLALTRSEIVQDLNPDEINGFLTEMVNALENTDYVLLADLMEYEIMPILEKWYNALKITIGEQ
ncbi:MAG: hypothetical protein PWQ70_1875 [Clostridiales bacterium]|nr:hypothetical protein [Clostridiales bacterium]